MSAWWKICDPLLFLGSSFITEYRIDFYLCNNGCVNCIELKNPNNFEQKMLTTKTYSIGEIFLSLKKAPDETKNSLNSVFSPFLSPKKRIKTPDISFTINGSEHIDLDDYTLIFDTLPSGLWKMWKGKNKDSYLLSFHNISNNSKPYLFAIANNNFSDFQIISKDDLNGFNPVESSSYELLLSGYLNINKTGITLHSALVSFNNKGYIFPGKSGSGKSSISGLWSQEKDAEVLADEQIMIRKKNGNLYSFSTPWQGNTLNNKNKGVPLQKIFFIKHGNKNALQKLSTLDAANRLMVRCFPTFWHRDGMQFALDFCTRIASEIGCFEFSFVSDSSAVEFIKENIT